MPIIGRATGFNYTDRWGVDIGHPSPIQMGSRPPSEADWEQFTPEEKALFGLPDWNTYQQFQQAYEKRSAPGGDIYGEKAKAAQILLKANPQTWEQARQILIQNGYDPSPQGNGPLFKELETLWNGGEFAAGGHGATVGYPGTGLSGIAGWLPGMAQGLAMQEWMRTGKSSMEGYDPTTGTYWNRRPNGTIDYFDITGNRLNGPPNAQIAAMAAQGGGGGAPFGMGSYGAGGGGSLEGELAQQAHLDTLMQQFLYEKAGKEYAQAIPLENYYKNLLGDIMGVDFSNGPEFSLGGYFQAGMQGAGGGGGGGGPIPFQMPDQNDPANWGGGGAPQGGSDTSGLPPASQPPMNQEPPLSAMAVGRPVRFDEGPVTAGGPGPGDEGRVSTNLPQTPIRAFEIGGAPTGGAAGLPPVPFPTQQGPGYSLKSGPAMDLADRTTWGLLAPEVNRRVSDMDSLLSRYKQEMPIGGERSAGVADMLKNLGGQIYGIRGDLLQNAMQGIAGLAGAKKGYNPAGYSGSGQALLSDATTRAGQAIGQDQFSQNLAWDKSKFAQQLQLERSNANKSLWGGLLNTVGQLLPALL